MEDTEIFPHTSSTELSRLRSCLRESKKVRDCWSEGKRFRFSVSSGMLCPSRQSRRRSCGSLRTKLFLLLAFFLFVLALSADAKDDRWFIPRYLLSSLRISPSDLQNRRYLDQNIQQAAFRQFDRHKTGRLYTVSVTAPGISSDSVFQAMRLRVGSFKKYGVTINEFTIPRGCQVNPAPERILLVYARLGNTSVFQNLPGALFLASPVVSILAYDASSLNSTELPDMLSVTSSAPISVQIEPLSPTVSGLSCVSFDENTTSVSYSTRLQSACDVNHLGAFALASNVTVPGPATSPLVSSFPKESHESSKAWKIAVGTVIGGLALLAVVSALAFAVIQHRKKARLAVMVHKADQGESLQTAVIRNSRAPAAGSTRTQPTLERDSPI